MLCLKHADNYQTAGCKIRRNFHNCERHALQHFWQQPFHESPYRCLSQLPHVHSLPGHFCGAPHASRQGRLFPRTWGTSVMIQSSATCATHFGKQDNIQPKHEKVSEVQVLEAQVLVREIASCDMASISRLLLLHHAIVGDENLAHGGTFRDVAALFGPLDCKW